MESLSDILSGATAPEKTETPVNTPEAKSEPAKDDKPAESKAPAASAPSAEQAKPDDKPDEKAGDKPVDQPEAKEDSQPRDDKGKFAAKPDELESLRTAHLAERKKRQEAERRAREAEERAAAAAKPKDDKPKKDFWDDPEGALEERLSAREQKLQQEADARYFTLCETIVKREHADYEEIVGELMEETDADKSLAQQVFAAAKAAENPAEYLYKTAKNRREMKAVGGDLDKFKDSLTTPLKTTIAERDKTISDQAKQIKSLQDQLDKLGKVPSSLNAEPSASRAAVDAESAENDSLTAIVEPRKKRRA